jgi:CheY-like chemotaxis protein
MEQSILLVEDEEAMRMVVGDRLRLEGYAVDCAPDGDSGFQKATSRPFELTIFDIMLPRRSGLDLCRDVRTAGLDLPILLLTACHEPKVKAAGLEVGADDYVTKPVDMRDLSARVEALLRRKPISRPRTLRMPAPQVKPTPQSTLLTAKAASECLMPSPVAPGDRKMWEEFEPTVGARIESSKVSEAIPVLRKMLAEEQQNPLTRRDRGLLSVTEGIVGFLEDIFEGFRSPKRRK